MEEQCNVLCLDLELAEELRALRLDPKRAQLIARRMGALADPTRLMLVDALANAVELCVCDLAWISGKAQNLVSHHLKVLKQEGLAKSRREGKVVFYSLTDTGSTLYRELAPVSSAAVTIE